MGLAVAGWAFTRPALVEDGALRSDRVSDGRIFAVLTLVAALAVALAAWRVPVRRLVESQAARESDLLTHLHEFDPAVAESARFLLAAATNTVVLDEEVLRLITHWADVPTEYLTDYTDDAVTDRTDAELELREVMRDAGASSIQFRALGEMSPDALRAIANSLRGRPPAT